MNQKTVVCMTLHKGRRTDNSVQLHMLHFAVAKSANTGSDYFNFETDLDINVYPHTKHSFLGQGIRQLLCSHTHT